MNLASILNTEQYHVATMCLRKDIKKAKILSDGSIAFYGEDTFLGCGYAVVGSNPGTSKTVFSTHAERAYEALS